MCKGFRRLPSRVSDFLTFSISTLLQLRSILMRIEIDLPEDVIQTLEKKLGDLSQYTLELLAVEGYRSGALSAEQLHRMLSKRTQLQVETLLKNRASGQ
jgi:hypothetical protein